MLIGQVSHHAARSQYRFRPAAAGSNDTGEMAMTSTVDALILDLLEWIAAEPRSYGEVMEAWRTSCPRLPVWEDASDRGFVVRERTDGRGVRVLLAPAGRAFLNQHGRGRARDKAGVSLAAAGPGSR
jgi:hypothetical protein